MSKKSRSIKKAIVKRGHTVKKKPKQAGVIGKPGLTDVVGAALFSLAGVFLTAYLRAYVPPAGHAPPAGPYPRRVLDDGKTVDLKASTDGSFAKS